MTHIPPANHADEKASDGKLVYFDLEWQMLYIWKKN